jgi:ferredoxin
MKTQSFASGTAVGLVDWLKQESPDFSLVVGATCRCDISQLGRDICDHLNRAGLPAGGRCRAFGPDEIRQLSGDPVSRHAILAAAARKGIDLESGCDYECMVRAIAALGGAVMSGEWAFEATADMDPVFRVALSHCDRCCPDALLKLDPEDYSAQGLARIIAKRFLHWIDDQAKGRKPGHPRASALPMLL